LRYLALACDYDGTIAADGKASPATLKALQNVSASGRKLILVTGRLVDDLIRTFPEHGIFESIVAENGAVLYHPATKKLKALAGPVPAELVAQLRRRRVTPLEAGHSIVAMRRPHDGTALRVMRKLGLSRDIVYNKTSVMILPPGINKGTGLLAALDELDVPENSTVGVGDAENDLALIEVCGCGVAVANAVPELKQAADIITKAADGQGVQELIERLLQNDLAGVETHSYRAAAVVGTDAVKPMAQDDPEDTMSRKTLPK
jgi:hydroxymethylpyrimidine pyrophosphatase-like HAD family hydrolase